MKVYVKPVGVIGTNCYIVSDEKEGGVVVDPGEQAEKLIETLEKLELKPSHILLTHGHYDHIGAVKALVRTFGCKVVIGHLDAEQLSNPEKSLVMLRGKEAEEYIIQPDILVREGDVIEAGDLRFEVLDTPGHTKGDVTYRCGEKLFTGDTLFAGSIGRTDLYGGDYKKIIASIKKLAALPGDFRVLPGHGPDSLLSVERESNPYLGESAHDYFY